MTDWLRLRHVAETVTSNVDKRKYENEIPVRLINYTDVYYGDRLTPDLPLMWATASASEIARHRVAAGDVLITKDSETADDIGIAAYVESSADDLVCGYHLSRIRAHKATVEPRYLYWALTGSHARGQLNVAATGVTRFGLRADSIRDLSIRVPPLPEQRAIADYLDTETNRIDTLMTKKRRMIELLEERRSNYVSEAVTVGLDSGLRLAHTGNRYAPQIPRTWRLMRLRHAVRQIIDTPHKTAPVVDDEKYLVVRTSNVKQGRLVLDDARYTDRASWFEWNRRGEPRPGDVMFTREAPAGEACVVPAAIPLCIGQRMVLFRVNRGVTCGEWVMHSIYSGPAQRFIEDLSRSTTVAHLNMSDIPDIPIVVPDLGEQKEILSHIRAAVRRQELTVSKLQQQMELLTERRQSVINAAVTGELAVSGRVK